MVTLVRGLPFHRRERMKSVERCKCPLGSCILGWLLHAPFCERDSGAAGLSAFGPPRNRNQACGPPKWPRTYAYDGVGIRQVRLVCHIHQAVAADDSVEFFLKSVLHSEVVKNVENGPGKSVRSGFLQAARLARVDKDIYWIYLPGDEQIQDDVAQLYVAKFFPLTV